MARRKRTYFLRSAYLGILLFVLFMCWVSESQSYRYDGYGNRNSSVVVAAQRQAEMGRYFFVTFAMFSVVAMHLIGPVLTSTAIGSEKLRRTLDVLLMTPINAWQIVGGKLSSRMLTAVMLLGLTLPVLAIVRLLGGVEIADVFGALTLAAATALGSAALGLWLSCYMKRAWAVILMAYLIQAAIYFVLPLLGAMLIFGYMRSYQSSSSASPAFWMTAAKVFLATHPVYTTGLMTMGRGMGTFSWWPAVWGQMGLALVLTLMSARVVRRHARHERGESAAAISTPMPPAFPALPIEALTPTDAVALSPPLPGTLDYQKPSGFDRPLRAHRPVSDYPILWHELRRPLLARTWQRVLATSIVLALLGLSYLGLWGIGELHRADSRIGYAFIFHGLLFLIAIVLSATAIATEKESDTWTLLIATPISGATLVAGKLVGVLRRLMWPCLLMVAHFGGFILAGLLSPWGGLIATWVTITFIFPWIATGLYFSLRCTRVTTAVVLNLLMPVLVYGVVPLVLLAIGPLIRAPGWRGDALPELTLYYLPWWYLGEGIDRFGWSANFESPIYLGGRQVTMYEFLAYMFIAGIVQIAFSGVVLWWMSFRFNRMVGRADG